MVADAAVELACKIIGIKPYFSMGFVDGHATFTQLNTSAALGTEEIYTGDGYTYLLE